MSIIDKHKGFTEKTSVTGDYHNSRDSVKQ